LKLITAPESPFGARVLIAARAKGIALQLERPAQGTVRSPEFRAINPISKIPVLLTERGTIIPESAAILDYLDDRFPQPSLRPVDPDERARVNVAVRITDAYIMAPVIRTFPHLNPATRDARVVDNELMHWQAGLAALAHFLAVPLPGAAAGVSLADCVLPPSLHLSARISRLLGLQEDLLAPHSALVAYYARIKDHPIVGPVLAELTAAQAAHDTKPDKQGK
jgi:maleylpyruvate isomerase